MKYFLGKDCSERAIFMGDPVEVVQSSRQGTALCTTNRGDGDIAVQFPDGETDYFPSRSLKLLL